MIKREGAILGKGIVRRTARIKNRITRGFFSPTNRAPKWGDELLDEIDYYPEEYLNRLAHNGTNGLWIYTSFGQLVKSPYMPELGKDSEKRMEKLSRVVAKCKKYGVKVYVFAIEPMGLLPEERAAHADMLGADTPMTANSRQPMCPRLDKTRDHIIYCLETIFKTIPDLGGYIDITAGERPTTCASVGHFGKCPRCSRFSRGENLAYSVDVIKEGLRRAGTGAEFISWTYGHRYWDDNDIIEYIEKSPSDVMFMQNFEDRGVDVQLGRDRVAWDYWLSYPGPSDMFKISAKRAKELGKTSYAKMQVCSSHEMATVPYIPAPGILFDKYKAAVELGVEGIMECWYFGNYPSLMNRASTELSYLESFDDKAGFLRSLAARIYGESLADSVATAWAAFEEGYRNYPTNIMFSYYGPMHDGVVWDLFPIPKNRALPRSWLLLDPPDGDRIGECLFRGHTLDEAITLAERMSEAWERGLRALPFGCDDEHTLCARAIGTLISSGKNILNFYKKREELGEGVGDSYKVLFDMESIVRAEIENSKIMTELCGKDTRLGYHSEAEGFKFFPEKLEARIKKLKALFDGDFRTIRERLDDGKAPLGYYYAEDEDYYTLTSSADSARVVALDTDRSFSAYTDGERVILNIKCKESDSFSACFEFSLFHPESMVVYSGKGGGSVHTELVSERGEGLTLGGNVISHQSVLGDEDERRALAPYSVKTKISSGVAEHTYEAVMPEGAFDGKRAIKLALRVGGVAWKSSKSPTRTLGKADVSPCDFGFLLPKM